MNEEEGVESKLQNLSESPVPALPGNIQSRVWRSIHRLEEVRSPVLLNWPLWLVQPVMALVFLIGTTTFGFLYGAENEGSRADNGKIAWADPFDANSIFLAPGSSTSRRR